MGWNHFAPISSQINFFSYRDRLMYTYRWNDSVLYVDNDTISLNALMKCVFSSNPDIPRYGNRSKTESDKMKLNVYARKNKNKCKQNLTRFQTSQKNACAYNLKTFHFNVVIVYVQQQQPGRRFAPFELSFEPGWMKFHRQRWKLEFRRPGDVVYLVGEWLHM